MIAAGAPAELVEKVACKQNETPDIQPANVITVRLFFAVCTQWEHAGMAAARTGLNYAAVEARARALPEYLGLSDELRCWVWDGLQRMELAALKVWQDAT